MTVVSMTEAKRAIDELREKTAAKTAEIRYTKQELALEELRWRKLMREAKCRRAEEAEERKQRKIAKKQKELAKKEFKMLEAERKRMAEDAELKRLLATCTLDWTNAITQYFIKNPLFANRRPTTVEIMERVLGLPKKINMCQTSLRRVGRIMHDLGFVKIQGSRSVTPTPQQVKTFLEQKSALTESLRNKTRTMGELTERQRKMASCLKPEDMLKKQRGWFWVMPTDDNGAPLPLKIDTLTEGAKRQEYEASLKEAYTNEDVKRWVENVLDRQPNISTECFKLEDVYKLSQGSIDYSVSPVDIMNVLLQLGYESRTLIGPELKGVYWVKSPDTLGLPPPNPLVFGEHDELDDVDVFFDNPEYRVNPSREQPDYKLLPIEDDSLSTYPDWVENVVGTGAAPGALDGYYDELDDDEDFA